MDRGKYLSAAAKSWRALGAKSVFAGLALALAARPWGRSSALPPVNLRLEPLGQAGVAKMKLTRHFTGVAMALAAGGALALATPAAADTTFFDGTFSNGNWSQTEFTATNGGASSATQQLTGGNPGAYFEVSNAVNPTGSSTAFYARSGAVYTPSVQGAITGIDYAVDESLFTGGVGDAELGVMQGGSVYLAFPEANVFSNGWQGFIENDLTAASFARIVPGSTGPTGELVYDSSQNPDFSATGGALTFGFVTTFNSPTGGGSFASTWGVDNWSVDVQGAGGGVPEPGAWALMLGGFGLAGAALRRRRLGQPIRTGSCDT
jgi:hypothetical protein